MPEFARHMDPRRSLAIAIGWLVVALSLTIAATAAWWLGAMARTSLLQQHGRQLALTTDQWAAELELALSSRLQSVQALATLLGARLRPETARVLRMTLRELQSTYPEFEWIGLADAQGKVLAATGGLLEGDSIAERRGFVPGLQAAWIGAVQDGITPLMHLHRLSRSDARRFVRLVVPVRDARGHAIGVLSAELNLRWVQNYAQGLREILQRHDFAQAWVLDGESVIVVGPEALQGQHWASESVDDRAFADAPPPVPGDHVRDTVPAIESLADGQAVLVARAQARAGSVLQTLGWRVQLVEPAEHAYQRADRLWIQILWMSLGLGAGAALSGVLIARHLTRRLTALTVSVQRVGLGQAQDIQVPAGVDEVARLGAAFAHVLSALQRERRELRALSAELEQRVALRTREIERLAEETRYAAVVRERLKIARDLHDTLAHSMMAMLAQVRLLKKLHTHDPAALPDELAHAEQAAHQGLKEARAAIAQLRFNAVRDVGLGAALADAIKHFSERTGLVVDFSSAPRPASLADARAETLFRIFEEALRNIERHAKASVVKVILLDTRDGQLELSIEDNGVGFDAAASYPGHYGLLGLREQAQLIGAELTIHSAPRAGTTVRLALRLLPDL